MNMKPVECKASSSNYPMAVGKPNQDFVDSPFLDAPLRKASQVQVNQRARMNVQGGLANIGLAPQPLLGEAADQGQSGCLINIRKTSEHATVLKRRWWDQIINESGFLVFYGCFI